MILVNECECSHSLLTLSPRPSHRFSELAWPTASNNNDDDDDDNNGDHDGDDDDD